MFKVADNIRNIFAKSIKSWKTELISYGERIGKVNIKRGMFQGDSLSPILFVLYLIPLSMIRRNVRAGYQFRTGQVIIKHLLFMDDLKLFGKNETYTYYLVKTVHLFMEDIGMKFRSVRCW